MFWFITFIHAKNFCVETTRGKCKEICSNFQGEFDESFSKIPSNRDIKTDDNSTHNIYVADIVDYVFSSHNIISCDPSIYLKCHFNSQWTKIKIGDDIKIRDDVIDHIYSIKRYNISLSFITFHNFILEIDNIENFNYKSQVILKTIRENLFMKPIFYASHLHPNLVSISNDSFPINIFDVTENVKFIFNDTSKLIESQKTYYCISDKVKKCEKYSSQNLIFINSPSEITYFPFVLIVDSSHPQIFTTNFDKNYAHIIGLPGSDITYYPNNNKKYNSDYYVIIHNNTIEMTNCFFEGNGKFTLSIYHQLLLHSTTKVNNINFTLKHQKLFNYKDSLIRAYNKNVTYEIANKIKVPDFNVFHGDDNLLNLFESGKFIPQSNFKQEIDNIDELKEYYYDDFEYFFTKNENEIPKTWKKKSSFYGNYLNNITFNDCYSFDGKSIDNFISVYNFDTININPSQYYYLKSFSTNWDVKFKIHIDHDLTMKGDPFGNVTFIDRDEIKKEKCTISGKGTITFLDLNFLNDVKQLCNYDINNIKFKFNSTVPKTYICIGQSDLNKCKSEIQNISLYQNKNWIWLRNINTVDKIFGIQTVFITDDQKINKLYSIIITENSHILYQTDSITIRKNGTSYIEAQKSSAKLTVLFSPLHKYHEPYVKNIFRIYIENSPAEIDLKLYFNYENVQLYQYYIENFQNNSVLIDGKGVLYIREPYLPMINMFNFSREIKFAINPDPDYHQICYAENVNECQKLYDFVFSSNYSKFVEYDAKSINANVYLYKNISLSMNSNHYVSSYFLVNKKITISFNLPNSATILFYGVYFEIIEDKTYCFKFSEVGNTIILDIKDDLIFDCSYPKYYYNITLQSSKKSVEIIPGPFIKNMISYNTFNLLFCANFTIYSPVPQYLEELTKSNILNKPIFIQQSPSWSYLYLSEEAKNLFEQYQSFSINDFQNDSNLSQNIVLAVGSNDTLIIPSNWSDHNIYVLQEKFSTLNEKPKNLTYLKDGIILNNKTKIISGKLSIYVPNSFTVNLYLPNGHQIYKYMYEIKLNCSYNFGTTLHIGSTHINQIQYTNKLIQIYNYSNQNKLNIRSKNQNDIFDLKLLMYNTDDKNINYNFGYDYICYYPQHKVSSKCSG